MAGVVFGSNTKLLTVPFHSSGIGGGARVALASAVPLLFFLSAALGGISSEVGDARSCQRNARPCRLLE
eukprot:CAMPEP_0171231356 /NCGR_PEP_ID=MMETSP0790-20130122/39860_1 /TAXON_ID=2925 /ORGANISM="Alexandrium catenella, Strain OF101" /LENGTH=68 /DNA_ID=CAMNT_0011697577 /DNA_START=293 /DNA_END=496 /DNA_ORIENTATION=-